VTRRPLRRCALALAVLAALASAAGRAGAGGPEAPIAVGAIRWDAWHGERGVPGRAVERSLAPLAWRDRLPFFARVQRDGRVRIDGIAPETMDREIGYAAHAGLDYWAFVSYPPDDPMSAALQLYLASPRRGEIGFCLILQGGWMSRGGRDAWPQRLAWYGELLAQPGYRKTPAGRPLVFLFAHEGMVAEGRFASWDEARAALDSLRNESRRVGAGEPYIVAQEGSPEAAAAARDLLKLDAIGLYSIGGGTPEGRPYAELAAKARRLWERSVRLGAETVPTAGAGWDKRPRVENPVPWERRTNPNHFAQPTPGELAAHVADAIRFARENATRVPARTVLVYAWNEHDEGGWLVPTLSGGTARIDALRPVLRPQAH
jgi:hypothetical protein